MNLSVISNFYNRLQDEESRILFSLKWDFLFKKGYADFMETLLKLDYPWNMSDNFSSYDDFRSQLGDKKVIIFGAGIDGKMTYDILLKNNIPVYAFCDNSKEKHGTVICGCKVITPYDLKCNCKEYFVVVPSRRHAGDILRGLTSSFFPRENIWYPRLGTMYATTGKQYFDCPELEPLGKEEVFIDAGCFDGDTSREFVKWSGGQYKRIIAFEPDKQCYQNIIEESKVGIPNFEVLPYATWSSHAEICFSNDTGGGGKTTENGNEKVIGESIDNVLKGDKATFIKMDVEGAELESLKGAAYTIKNYRPRLAISIYHKPSDIYEIPELLMELCPDYRFYIRHYTSCLWETVLYAI